MDTADSDVSYKVSSQADGFRMLRDVNLDGALNRAYHRFRGSHCASAQALLPGLE